MVGTDESGQGLGAERRENDSPDIPSVTILETTVGFPISLSYSLFPSPRSLLERDVFGYPHDLTWHWVSYAPESHKPPESSSN